jgi:hypothetical protein
MSERCASPTPSGSSSASTLRPPTATPRLRQVMVGRLEELIAGSHALSARKRAELAGRISMLPGPHHYLRQTPASCRGSIGRR